MYPNVYIPKLIEEYISHEIEDMNYYNNLSRNVTDIEDKRILKEIAIDEEKHSKMLTDLYTEINGSNPNHNEENTGGNSSLLNALAKRIEEETKAVENYRVLLFAFDKPKYKNMITEIITDEQNHAAKLNYLYSKNR